jgi:hypothetical protein
MNISLGLMRAGVAIIVFGLIASQLPSNGIALAQGGACTTNANGVSDALIVVGGAAAVGVGAVLIAAPGKKHKAAPSSFVNPGVSGQTSETQQGHSQWSIGPMDNYIYSR